MEFRDKCKLVEQCIPDSPFKEQIVKLHNEMLALLPKCTCDKCGTTDVAISICCHNSGCSEYANERTVYEGWKVDV